MKEPLLTQPALPRDLAGRPSTAAWEFPAYEGSSLNMRVERIVGSSLNMRVDRITLVHLLSVRTTARVSDLTVLESSLPLLQGILQQVPFGHGTISRNIAEAGEFEQGRAHSAVEVGACRIRVATAYLGRSCARVSSVVTILQLSYMYA